MNVFLNLEQTTEEQIMTNL